MKTTERIKEYAERRPDWAKTDGSETVAMAELLERASKLMNVVAWFTLGNDQFIDWLKDFEKFQEKK